MDLNYFEHRLIRKLSRPYSQVQAHANSVSGHHIVTGIARVVELFCLGKLGGWTKETYLLQTVKIQGLSQPLKVSPRDKGGMHVRCAHISFSFLSTKC